MINSLSKKKNRGEHACSESPCILCTYTSIYNTSTYNQVKNSEHREQKTILLSGSLFTTLFSVPNHLRKRTSYNIGIPSLVLLLRYLPYYYYSLYCYYFGGRGCFFSSVPLAPVRGYSLSTYRRQPLCIIIL